MNGLVLGGVFALGTIIGSFINCLVDRLKRREDFLWTRSYCPECHHSLAWFDLLPLISFLWLRGRCRYCRKRIPWENPLVELITGLFLLVIVWGIEDIPLAIFLSIALIFLEIIFLFDLKYSLIPNQFIYPALILTLLFWGGKDLYSQGGFSLNSSYFLSSLLGSAIFSGFLGFLYLLTRGKGMGLGDVELGLLLGAILGWPLVVPALFFGFLLGAIIGLGLMVFRKKGWKSEIPFGPFLILGSAIAFIGGEAFLNFVL